MRLAYTAGDAVSSPYCHDMVGLAVLAALKCHDLAGQDTIAVEPCTGGYRLVRRTYPENLPSLPA